MAGNSPQTRLMMPMEAGLKLNLHIWDNMVVVGAPAADTCTKARRKKTPDGVATLQAAKCVGM